MQSGSDLLSFPTLVYPFETETHFSSPLPLTNNSISYRWCLLIIFVNHFIYYSSSTLCVFFFLSLSLSLSPSLSLSFSLSLSVSLSLSICFSLSLSLSISLSIYLCLSLCHRLSLSLSHSRSLSLSFSLSLSLSLSHRKSFKNFILCSAIFLWTVAFEIS